MTWQWLALTVIVLAILFVGGLAYAIYSVVGVIQTQDDERGDQPW